MDDQLEGEVLCEVFWAHVHLMGRYLALTSAGLGEMVTLGAGETLRGKMLQPGPFLFLVFLAIVGSVALQNSGHLVWEWLSRTHSVLGLDRVADSTLRSLDLSASCGSAGSGVWELREGAVGVFGLQGRRATMEDRYCVIQDVDVGSKTLSFLGVFDGHGGQYTAEFVKDNLFQNTIDKIKQLHNQTPVSGATQGSGGSSSNSSNSNSNNNNKGNGCGEARTGAKTLGHDAKDKAQKRWVMSDNNLKEVGDVHPPTTTSTSHSKGNNSSKVSTSINSSTKTVDAQCAQEKTTPATNKEGKASEDEHPAAVGGGVTGGGSCIENLTSSGSTTSTTTTTTTTTTSTTSPSSSSSPSCTKEDDSVSQKKDDNYSSVNLRRSSLTSSLSPKDKKEETAEAQGAACGTQNDSCYIDVLQNINYTRLLTDQILAVDRQVVAHCKARTDMSGSTAVVAVLDGELLVIGNVGDSRAVMGDLKGSTIPLSFDHKPNQLKERRRIKEAGGFISFTGVWRVAGVLATSRALGDFPLKEPRQLITAEPDVLTFSLTDHRAHFIILATDGLWDVMSNEEAVAFVRDHLHEPDHGAKSLTMHAFHRGSQDNITVAILNVSKLLHK